MGAVTQSTGNPHNSSLKDPETGRSSEPLLGRVVPRSPAKIPKGVPHFGFWGFRVQGFRV